MRDCLSRHFIVLPTYVRFLYHNYLFFHHSWLHGQSDRNLPWAFIICLMLFAVTILKFLIIYKQGVPHFHFAVDFPSPQQTCWGRLGRKFRQTFAGHCKCNHIPQWRAYCFGCAVDSGLGALRSVSSQRWEWGQTWHCPSSSLVTCTRVRTHSWACTSQTAKYWIIEKEETLEDI